jgi:hypothetical protein
VRQAELLDSRLEQCGCYGRAETALGMMVLGDDDPAWIPMKIASTKNEKPSIANPRPNTLPNVPMKFGHSNPISKLNTVPVITPTANSVKTTRDHRRASVR